MFFINGILIGIVATLLFDLYQNSLFYAYNINKPKWYLIGRYFYGYKNKKYLTDDLENDTVIKNELIIGYIAHYIIGSIFGVICCILTTFFFIEEKLIVCIVLGFVTVLGNWCFLMPFAFNIGFFASKKDESLQIMVQNLLADFIFGIGLFIGTSIVV